MFIWNMEDTRRAEAMDSIEKTLSAIGVEGGNCQLKQDKKRSGKHTNVVLKPSLSGKVATRLFCPSTWSTYDRVWKEVCMSEFNNLEGG